MNHTFGLIRYNDLLFRLIISVVAGHGIVSFGESRTLWELLLMPVYYVSLLVSFLIAFVLISVVRLLTIRLDRYLDWMDSPFRRAVLQVALGVLPPAILAFLLAALFFALQGINILDTVYLKFDFPVIVLAIILMNVYYLAYYLYINVKHSHSPAPATLSEAESKDKRVIIVNRGTKNIPVSVSDICYFFRQNDINYLRDVSCKDFMLTQSLDELQEQLDEREFFRANRQMIVSFSACHHFEVLPYGKLQLFLHPEFKEPVVISQKRAKAFRDWMER